MTAVWLGLATMVAVVGAFIAGLKVKHLDIWVGAYFRHMWRRTLVRRGLRRDTKIHVLFCMVDHFEPVSAGSTYEQERVRLDDWLKRYPLLASRHHDSDGRPPQHTWFYPAENYRTEYLDDLARLCEQGFGEIELHLHHGHDTGASLTKKIEAALSDFAKHGALVTNEVPPRHVYAFIHGNMALDNSMDDPSVCGVNDELTVLQKTGCYADFSLPTAPAVSQTKIINSIYYASDDRHKPKSHDTGREVQVGGPEGNGLMIVQGPLGLDWRRRKFGLIPKIENAEIQGSNPPSFHRIHNWINEHVHVSGRPEWIVVKVSCHGAEDRSRDVLLGDGADEMYSALEQQYRDREGYALHYVTARELYNIIKAAENNRTGNPNLYRDYMIPRYRTHGALPKSTC